VSTVVLRTPQFDRATGEPRPIVPPDADFFESLREMDGKALREVGMRPWNDPNNPDETERARDADRFGKGNVLWLFPGEWYEHIPTGFYIVDVFGEHESFSPGNTDDETHCGVLAFGILVAAEAR
jgi:hypothetical protein